MSTSADRETLSSIDTAWWRMEESPSTVTIAGALTFEEPLDFERFKDVVAERLVGQFPRFRQRVVENPGHLGRPHWEGDPNFEVANHVHHRALHDPGDQPALQEVMGELMTQGIDRSRPLWEIYVFDDYRGGSAVVALLHHCLGDGFALARVLLSLADGGIGQAAPASEEASRVGSGRSKSGKAHRSLTAELLSEVEEALLHPSHLTDLARDAGRVTQSIGHLLTMPFDPETVLKRERSGVYRVAWSERIPLGRIKAIGAQIGGTINDVLMMALAGALRGYLAGRNEPVDEFDVRAIVPVNLRPARRIEEMEAVLGNEFGLVFLELPIRVEERAARLKALQSTVADLKQSPEAVVSFGILNALGMTPPVIEQIFNEVFGRKATMVVSNVPGPREPLSFAGKTLDSVMFWPPHPAGLGLSTSLISYNDGVSVGVRADTGVLEEPEELMRRIEKEFDALEG